MTLDAPLLCRFESSPPRHVLAQEESLEWLARAHALAMSTAAAAHSGGSAADAVPRAYERMRKIIDRCACGPDRIARRGHEVPDCAHTRWDEMQIYPLRRAPAGVGMHERMVFYESAVDAIFERMYAPAKQATGVLASDGVDAAIGEARDAPRDIIHVTCTGYVSPSAGQKLVASRGWGELTRVTHAYHMGCYAAVPAVRVAWGLLHAGRDARPRGAEDRVDVVHTELCSLHLDLTQHTPEQLVIQSLFADGAIRYEVAQRSSGGGAVRGDVPGLRVLAMREAVLPGTADSMRWIPSDTGMQMALGRDVPQRIGAVLRPFLRGLFQDAGLDFDAERTRATFAVHPGGPKIIDSVGDALELEPAQLAASRRVLLEHGNMSSATLPHVWMRLTDGPEAVADGTIVASLAFGPGLTVCGAVFRKE